ncbi:hypothetical protein L6452_44240 [Arctium lappa]|uniref:Uncharacterized protein n=1 Tax=Arctium lappa TaxID=4217 RepID=A0ACB8XFM5_ARCLA|nr:hypothetical protein L6452_44240 [Arctium lappa]
MSTMVQAAATFPATGCSFGRLLGFNRCGSGVRLSANRRSFHRIKSETWNRLEYLKAMREIGRDLELIEFF